MRELTAQETSPLPLGREVSCSDGPVGRLSDVLVDPDARRITHLVVEDRDGTARLVPANLLRRGSRPGKTVVLACSSADVAGCEAIRSFSLVGLEGLPRGDDSHAVGVEDVQFLPGPGATELGDFAGDLAGTYGITYDVIPKASAELRRGSAVVSVEGDEVGKVDGFLVSGERLTHVVLQHKHFSHTGAAAIPIDSVTAIETDCITVAPAKDALDAGGVFSGWLPFA